MTCEEMIAKKIKERGMTIKTVSDRTGVHIRSCNQVCEAGES